MTEKPIREYDRFILRLPDGMREKLQESAKAHNRSMNSEVIDLLQSALENTTDRLIRLMTDDHARLMMRVKEAEAELNELKSKAAWLSLQLKHIKAAPVQPDGGITPEDFAKAMADADVEDMQGSVGSD